MKSNFDVAIGYVLRDEGGYAENENEPGGAVNRGITFELFKEVWEKEKKLPKPNFFAHDPPTFADLKALSEDETIYIYDTYIFPEVSFNELPPGVDYVMVNLRTMQGATGAKRILQESLGLPVTGKYNQDTWDVINKSNPHKLVGGLLLLQSRIKMANPRVGPWKDSKGKEHGGYGPGWGNRFWRVWDRANKMIEGAK